MKTLLIALISLAGLSFAQARSLEKISGLDACMKLAEKSATALYLVDTYGGGLAGMEISSTLTSTNDEAIAGPVSVRVMLKDTETLPEGVTLESATIYDVGMDRNDAGVCSLSSVSLTRAG